MLLELWAKVTANERFIVYGAVTTLVGWVIGLIVGGWWYGATGAQTFGVLAVSAAIAAVVVIYLKYAPNMKITWPAPLPLIQLVISAVAGVVALLGLLVSFTSDPSYGVLTFVEGTKPVTIYVAALVVVAGAGLMCWGAYQEWLPTKPGLELIKKDQQNPPQNPPSA